MANRNNIKKQKKEKKMSLLLNRHTTVSHSVFKKKKKEKENKKKVLCSSKKKIIMIIINRGEQKKNKIKAINRYSFIFVKQTNKKNKYLSFSAFPFLVLFKFGCISHKQNKTKQNKTKQKKKKNSTSTPSSSIASTSWALEFLSSLLSTTQKMKLNSFPEVDQRKKNKNKKGDDRPKRQSLSSNKKKMKQTK